MRCRLLLILAISLALAAVVAAISYRSDASESSTRIEVDQKASAIRFVVDGRETAVIDSDGLHVNGDIDFSGTIADGNGYSRATQDNKEAQ